jgi:hypothetical protein
MHQQDLHSWRAYSKLERLQVATGQGSLSDASVTGPDCSTLILLAKRHAFIHALQACVKKACAYIRVCLCLSPEQLPQARLLR